MGQPLLAAGDILRGKYRLEQVLGRGGMGTVHLASHLVIGQRVAIKVVNPSASEREYVVARFLREARAAALLESQHVVRILDVDAADDGTPFMVMEYLQGDDLGALLRKGGRLPLQDAVGYVLQACEALAEAHGAGIVHRDLKPSNLFRAETATRKAPMIKLLDFGISKLAAPGEDLSLTDTQSVIGSPLFMSPEQLLSSRDVDHRTDIWSIGVTLFQLLAGALPFEASSASALGAQIAAKSPRPLSAVLPNVPPGLEAAVMRCLERSPEARFPDVVSFARAIMPWAAPDEDLIASVERAAERGARSAHPPVSRDAPPAPNAVEASGERWTQSRVAGESTGSREKRVTAAPVNVAPQENWTQAPSTPPLAPYVTHGSGAPPPASVAPSMPPAAHVTHGSNAPSPLLEASSAAPVRGSKRTVAIVMFTIVAFLLALAATTGVTFFMKRRYPVNIAPTPSSSIAEAPTAPSSSSPSSSSDPSASTSTTPSAISSTAPKPTLKTKPRTPPKPGTTWSKDPSELELK